MTKPTSAWEDETPAETRFRRVRQGVPRVLPGMPLEFEDPEGDGGARPQRTRFDEPKSRRWWRPASRAGQISLAAGAVLVLGGLTTAGVMLRDLLERDARFRIAASENIQATGLAEVSRAEVLPLFSEDIGRNIFFVPLASRKKTLEAIPWIEKATVMRLLPDQVHVAVVERRPVAFTRQGNRIGLVDANGVLLSMSARTMAERHYSFPVLTGIDPGNPLPSRKARMGVYTRLMNELDGGGKRLSEQISEIDLTDPENARVLISEQGSDILAHFGDDHFLERYQRYKKHIAEWRQQYPRLAAVDLRYEQQVILQMASGTETKAPVEGKADPAGVKGQAESASQPDKAKSTTKEKPVEPSAKAAVVKRTAVSKKPPAISTATRPTAVRDGAGAKQHSGTRSPAVPAATREAD
jgi:cell division protein FtsQ